MKNIFRRMFIVSFTILIVFLFDTHVPAHAQITGGPTQTQNDGTRTTNRTTQTQESQGGEVGTGAELVKCGRISDTGVSGRECTFEDLITLVGDTITFIIKNVIIPLLVLGLVYHGTCMVIFKDKASEIGKIKKGIWSMLIGIFFMLTAWLLVETITKSFGVKYNTDPKKGVVDFLK